MRRLRQLNGVYTLSRSTITLESYILSLVQIYGLLFEKCTVSDIDALRNLSIITSTQTFAPFNSKDNMALYLDSAFNKRKLLSELNNANSEFYLMFFKNILCGCLKIIFPPAQTDFNDARSAEIERLYITKEFYCKGLGKYMLDYASDLARLH